MVVRKFEGILIHEKWVISELMEELLLHQPHK